MTRYIALCLVATHTKMAFGFLSNTRGDNILGMDRRAVVGVVILVVVGAAAGMFLLGGGGTDGGDSGETPNAALDTVPDGVDGVIYVDGNVTEDEMMLETLDGGLQTAWWFLDDGEAPSIDVVTETLDTEGIDYEATTAFLKDPTGEDAPSDYAGATVELGSGSTPQDLVSLLEEEVGELESDTYSGVDVHKVDLVEAAEETNISGVTDQLDVTGLIGEFVGEDTTAWVASIDENTAVLGSAAAARDAIDVHQGEADPVEGPVRISHEEATPAPIEATLDASILESTLAPLPEVAGVISPDVQGALEITGGEPALITSSLDVRDRNIDTDSFEQTEEIRNIFGDEARNGTIGTMTFDVVITMVEKSGGEDLFRLFKDFVDPDTILDDPKNISELDVRDRAGGGRNGRHINFEIPLFSEQLVDYVGAFVDEFADDPEPRQMVPADAQSIVQVDATEAQSTDALFQEATAAGLLETEGDISAQQALDYARTETDLTFDTATTFRGEGDYQATYVETDISVGKDGLLDRAYRRELRDRTGEDFDLREQAKGYNSVDIFQSPVPDQPLNLTRYLSGFQTTTAAEWFAPISNTSLLFGTEEAVKDAIDLYRGVNATAQTPLHEAHNRTEGTLRASGTVDSGVLGEYADAIDETLGDALSGTDPAVLSTSLDQSGSGPVLGVQIDAGDESGASDLADALEAAGVTEATADSGSVSERAGYSVEGRYLTLEVPYELSSLGDDVESFVQMFGDEPFPSVTG